MSNTTWRRVEEGQPVRDTTYARVDQVLDWPSGSAAAILGGDETAPIPGETAGGVRYSQPPLSEEALRSTISEATMAALPDLTGSQIRALQERAVEEARRRGLLP